MMLYKCIIQAIRVSMYSICPQFLKQNTSLLLSSSETLEFPWLLESISIYSNKKQEKQSLTILYMTLENVILD